MDRETVKLNEVREGEISQDVPFTWDLKRNDKNELTKQRETHRLREQTYGCRQQEGKDGEKDSREFGMDMYTLLYFNWITNKSYCIKYDQTEVI